MVVHRDGRIRRLSANLGQQIWSMHVSLPASTQNVEKHVVAAASLSGDHSELGIFKKRPDIAAELAQSLEISGSATLLLLVLRETSREGASRPDIYLEAHLLPHGSANGIGSSTAATKCLLRNQFPKDHDRWSAKANIQIVIDPPKGTVDVSFERGIVSYDLFGYSADIVSQLLSETEVFSSLMRLSSTLTVAASSSAITTYDANYNSIRHRLPMDQVLLNRKRKRSTGRAMEEPIKFVGFFRRLNILVACRGNALLSFDITSDRNSLGSHSTRQKDGLLINAIGNGLSRTAQHDMKKPKNIGPGFGRALIYRNQEGEDKWIARKAYLDDLVDSGDMHRFEEDIALDLFGTAADETSLDELYKGKGCGVTDPEKISYALSRLLTVKSTPDDGESPSLRLRKGAPRLLRWLIANDWISMASFSRALEMNSPGASYGTLPVGGIYQAFTEADPSLALLAELLRRPNSLEASELVYIVQQYVMDALALQEQTSQGRLVTENGDMESMSHEPELVNGDVPSPEIHKVTRSSSQKSESSSSQRVIMLDALERLYTKPREEIVSTARSFLRGDGLLALIQLLRQQLYYGGYTTSFRSQPLLSPPASPVIDGSKGRHEEEGKILDLQVIVTLLSCCVDALGSLSVLSGSADNPFMEPLIADLRSEISSALQGVEEAAYLQGILREVWRYGASGNNKLTESHDQASLGLQPTQRHGEIITLISQASEDQFDNAATTGMLPLSLKMEAEISDYKVRRGGGQVLHRSGREKAGLEHRAVGKYSFERLTL